MILADDLIEASSSVGATWVWQSAGRWLINRMEVWRGELKEYIILETLKMGWWNSNRFLMNWKLKKKMVVLLFICCVITLQVTVSHVRRFSGWWCKTPAFSQWVYSIDFVYIASSLETENHLFQCRFLEIYTACIHIAYLVCKDCSHNISSRRNEMVNLLKVRVNFRKCKIGHIACCH